MKLYVLQAAFDYEGFHIEGILDNKEKAEEWLEKVLKFKRDILPGKYFWSADWYEIEEFELNNITNTFSGMKDD